VAAYNLPVRNLVCIGVTAVLACAAAAVQAQAYPNRTVRIVVPIAAGGVTDVFARTLAASFSEAWNQQVIVDNRPGAGGMIGSEIVAKAAPDGYTLLMAYTAHVTNPSLWTRLPYDTVHDFAPVTMVARVPSVLIVHPSLPVRSVNELITFARRRPHELDYGSSGVGTAAHLAAALFAQRAGLFLTHVPYRGGVPAMYELLGGQISIMFGSLATAIPNIRNGRIRALAVTGLQRAAALPEVPTMAAAALPGYEAIGWFALFAPARTSGTVVNRINAETVAMMNQQDIRERFLAQGAEFAPTTPAELGDRVRSEIGKWRGVIRAAGIAPMKN
jgi:tripartite-type tricarboxylate transporter receptor subunit TctC